MGVFCVPRLLRWDGGRACRCVIGVVLSLFFTTYLIVSSTTSAWDEWVRSLLHISLIINYQLLIIDY
jgi:hypothetical protein